MTQAITGSVVTSFATELAELLLNVENTQADSASLTRDAARKEVLDEVQHQVDALHAAADDMRNGAWVSAAFTVAGSVCQAVSAVETYDAQTNTAQLEALGNQMASDSPQVVTLHADIASEVKTANLLQTGSALFDKLAGVAKTFAGDAPAAGDNAKAKLFETLADQSKWLQGDASTEIDKAAKLADKVLDVLQAINQDQSSTNTALISRI